ncbi:hypothetical protein BST91_03240 [Nonlabens tegetincola]|uniref:LytR/AlgR family response regulator transcription factor n=1 Tax=Nonlabens tegetincola TaxID=323273 RepID=UPI000A209FD6|nr:LytTR family DNA-binding domain-containing protein [Nonlabens tegetincola]ARN70730.1 hypothetical protein BST91_03240 [Nonlabens tegetincola]
MLKTILIEDETYIRDEIKELISIHFHSEITIVAESDNVIESIKFINQISPDILILDIQIKGGTSFDILDNVDLHECIVIFITAYNDKAIKAIKIGAFDYILKPILEEEFVTSLSSAIGTISKKKRFNSNFMSEVSTNEFKTTSDNLVLKTADSIYLVNYDDILFCSSEGNYTTFHLTNKKKL